MPETIFQRDNHVRYFLEALRNLPCGYSSQESIRLTLCYFAVAGLDLLDALDQVNKADIVAWVYSLQVVPDTRANHPESSELAECDQSETSDVASPLSAAAGLPPTQAMLDSGGTQPNHAEVASGDGELTPDMTPNPSSLFGFRGSPSCGAQYSLSGGPPVAFEGGHLAHTFTSLAILRLLGDSYERVEREAAADGQADMRFLYCAAAISEMLEDWRGMCIPDAMGFIRTSQNYDGGFGLSPGLESHGGASYCAVAAFRLMQEGVGKGEGEGGGEAEGEDDRERMEEVRRWCAQRQCDDGGVQGRCCKEADTCYSFWVGASLSILGNSDWLNAPPLRHFLLTCQSKIGGFSKRPNEYPDVLHSFYGLCGLSLLKEPGLLPFHCLLGISERAMNGMDNAKIMRSAFDDVD